MKGQNTKSIQKKNFPNQRSITTGVKSLKFKHQAISGETIINLSSLNAPSGWANPSSSGLLIKTFSENLLISSSIKGLMDESVDYELSTNQTIRLLTASEEGEIFTIIFFNHAINGTLIGDVRTPNASGTLLEGIRDFNLGEAIPIKELTSQWPIQVFRGSSGTPMLRNTGNAEFVGDHSIGNYQMVDNGSGYCQVVRFNIAGDVGDEPVVWATHGALGERPNLSVLQHVDKLSGIVDKIRQDALIDFGFDVTDPTRYDQGVATNQDLKSFGDLVGLINSKYDSSLKLSDYTKTKTQTKVLASPFTGVGEVTDLTFNNLEVGKRYRVIYHIAFATNSNTQNGVFTGSFQGALGALEEWGYSDYTTNQGLTNREDFSLEFTAVSSQLRFHVSSSRLDAVESPNAFLQASSGWQTRAVLEELPNHETTTQWT